MAESKLSKEGSIKTWTILGFDPIRKDAWTDPAMTAANQYTDYLYEHAGNEVLTGSKKVSRGTLT